MKKFDSVDDVLDHVIERERESIRFYESLAGRLKNPKIQQVIEEFAREEQGHLENLLEIKKNKTFTCPVERITDLKIGDYLTDVEPNPKMDYQEALILAMKKEKEMVELYYEMMRLTDDVNLKESLRCLGQEEEKHKQRIEIIYDEHYL